MPEVIIEHHDGWAEIVLNRPEVRNAIDGPLGIALADAFQSVDRNEDTRVVILRGAGGAFCSGLDLKSFNAEPAPAWLADFQKIWRSAHTAIFNCRKPIVAVMERYAINGGAALALAADLLITGKEAFLQVGEVQQGMAAPYNLAWLRLRHSEALASRIALIGRRFQGVELETLGIAYSAVPDDEVLATAHELATQLAGYPSGALETIKAGLRKYATEDPNAWFDRVAPTDSKRPTPQHV